MEDLPLNSLDLVGYLKNMIRCNSKNVDQLFQSNSPYLMFNSSNISKGISPPEQESRHLGQQVFLYLPPFFLLIGTFGNVFSFILMRKKAKAGISTCFYLSVLAIADLLVLYTGCFRSWIGMLTGFDIQQYSWGCKLSVFLGYISSDFSVWVIIAVTVERFIVVWFPLRASSWSTIRRSILMVVSMLAIIVALNLHMLWTLDAIRHKKEDVYDTECNESESGSGSPSPPQFIPDEFSYIQCGVSDQYASANIINQYWPLVDGIIYSFLPIIIITTLNTLIIVKVIKAHRNRRKMTQKGLKDSIYYRSTDDIEIDHIRPRSGSNGSRSSGSSAKNIRMTIMLLSVSFTFLVTTLPIAVTLLFFNPSKTDNFTSNHGYDYQNISSYLMYLNHSINFYLYCATGARFRRDFMNLFRQNRRKFRKYDPENPHHPNPLLRFKFFQKSACSSLTNTTRSNDERNPPECLILSASPPTKATMIQQL